MPRSCTVCSHDASWQIDLDLVRREPYRNIAQRFGVSTTALSRHAQEHLPAKLLASQEASEVADADLLKRELESEKADIHRLKAKAEEAEDYKTALAACDKALKALELQAKLAQLIHDAPTLNLYLSPEWLEVRAVIVGALEPYQEARNAVLTAPEGVGNGVGLRSDLRLALDRVAFAERFVRPDPWQEDLLRSDSKRTLLNIARQLGKSTITGIIGLHKALYFPGSLVLVLAPSLRQSQELFSKIAAFYRELGRPVPASAERRLSLELDNGSRIVTLPGTEKSVRGFSGTALLLVDEAARVDDGLYYAVRPMLAVSGGALMMLSTPWGKRGVFHHEWAEGVGWERYEVPATECPRISPEFLEEERAVLPARIFRQEYLCSFEETEDQVFAHADVVAALDPDVKPLF